MNGMDIVMEVYDLYHEQIKQIKEGERIVVECPLCKGKLVIGKAKCNGHLHIICENYDVMIIQ